MKSRVDRGWDSQQENQLGEDSSVLNEVKDLRLRRRWRGLSGLSATNEQAVTKFEMG